MEPNAFYAAMDASPSDQLGYGPNTAHALAIAFFPQIHHCYAVAEEMEANSGHPKWRMNCKWKGKRGKMRTQHQIGFVRGLCHILRTEKVFIFGFISFERDIARGECHMLNELGARWAYDWNGTVKNGGSRVDIWHERYRGHDIPERESVPWTEAVMLLWMAFGIHNMIKTIDQVLGTDRRFHGRWHLHTDRLANARDQPKRLRSLRALIPDDGLSKPEIIISANSELLPPDIFADNLAGLFADIANHESTKAVLLFIKEANECPVIFSHVLQIMSWGRKNEPPVHHQRFIEEVSRLYPKEGDARTGSPIQPARMSGCY